MASLTVKNVPEDLLEALRKAAITNRRSLNQEIMHLLASALGLEKESLRSSPGVAAQLATWRKLVGQWKADIAAATGAEPVIERSR
jgi:plasmid stability protein